MIIIFILPIIIALLFYYYRTRKTKTTRTIKFVGPRGSGKTITLQHILGKKNIQTVPNIEDNTEQYKNKLIVDCVCHPEKKDFFEIYNFDDKNAIYFFFFNHENDLVDYSSGFNTFFVFYGSKKLLKFGRSELKMRLICLENEPDRLKKVIDEIK